MKGNISKKLSKRKKKIKKRLHKRNWENQDKPMMSNANIYYDIDGRNQGIANGGIGVIHQLSKKTGLVTEIDDRLELLKRYLPYHESDHVLNIAYNILAGGQCLQDLELLRNDEAWLNALNADIIPDPTTAGDFLRRFGEKDILELMEAKNTVRKKIWEQQSRPFRNEAIINIDGTISPTCGECKEGIDMSYNGQWSYHPLIVSLANTREPLYIVNRPGNAQNRTAWAALPDSINYRAPAVLPTIIHVFLYGGPSELAGNLSNITEIAANSQNAYPSSLDPGNSANDITPNAFWDAAGGSIMETMLASGDLSIYRTINRIKSDTKAHGTSVTQNLVGNLDVYGPGIATTLAAILEQFNAFGKPIEELVLPFVSFEGESKVFNLGDLNPSLTLRPMNLDSNFANPYQRSHNWHLDSGEEDTNDLALEALARDISLINAPRHANVDESFLKRGELEAFIEDNFNVDMVQANLPIDPDTNAPILYPDNSFGRNLKAAVSLAVNNPDTVFISLGSSGLGGWDDHSGGLDDYPARMQGLFLAFETAVKHLNLVSADTVVINVFGDFGRNVNLNNSRGWDHGNNQNLYALGGSGIAGRALGKLVGRTQRIGTPFQNRQFTSPTANSRQWEPFSIASTLFKYFGVQNPEVLTGETAIDESDNVADEKISRAES